jgi:hypothetical protein
MFDICQGELVPLTHAGVRSGRREASLSEPHLREADRAFERFAGTCAFIVGVGGLAYAITFVVVLQGDAAQSVATANALFLMLGGLLSTVVLVAVYGRVRDTDASFALWALLLGVVGAGGAMIHGGFELALAVDPPVPGRPGLPANPVDPRGLLTFGVTAVATLTLAGLIVRGGALPRRLGYLGYVSAGLLLVLYLGRLILVKPKSPLLLVAAVLSGFVVNPAWYAWLGVELRRGGRRSAPPLSSTS